MPKEMLINVAEGEECRIAVVEDGRLQELYMERTSAASHVGNIYKGRVTNVEASIQAAFIDFGVGRNGFLHVSDLLPTYFGGKGNDDVEEYVGKKMARRDRPPIQRCLRRGDEIIVQVIKEGIGTKGPTLSSYLSISGKMLVMMPGVAGRGVSKKIEDEDERRRLKRILVDLDPPEDCGFIIRTEAVDKDGEDIERDLTYLARLWEQIKERRDAGPGPSELYTEGDLVTRTVRDVFSSDVTRVVVDHPDVARRVKDVIRISSPTGKNRVEVYDDPVPLFSRFGIEYEIEQMYSRHVPLPSGGSLVIDSTEAVVTIDVNSGKMRDHNDAEMTAFKTDMEAAEEIPRQLKLRDLGGVIICDFIDLRYERHRRELEERLFENFKDDRAKTKVLRMSQFGIIELTRQRMRPSLKRSIYADCPHCKGAGLVKTPESMALDLMRRLAIAANDARVVRLELNVCADVAFHLLNKKRAALADLEHKTGKQVVVRVDPALGLDEMRFELFDGRDGSVILEEIGMTVPERGHTSQLGVRPPGHTSQARGGRGGERGGRDDRSDGRRPPPARMSPARALEGDGDDDVDDLDEDDRQAIARGEAAVEERERSQGLGNGNRRQPVVNREADRTDMPAILETEAGDEAADELADEDLGTGQGDDVDARDRRPAQGRSAQPPVQEFVQGREFAQGRESVQGRQAQPADDQPGDDQPGEGGTRRRRRRRRGRGRGGEGGGDFAAQPGGQSGGQAGGQSGGVAKPNDPRGPTPASRGGPGRPADGGNANDPRAQYAGDLADRVANESGYDDGEDDAYDDHAAGDVNGNRHPVDDLPEDDGIDYGNADGDADGDADVDAGNPAGAVGTFNDVEPADAIGPAAEGGDSIAEDELNTALSDRPASGGPTAEGTGEGDGHRRRRRRRGGRRHRRSDEPGRPAGEGAAEPSDDVAEPQGEPILDDDADAGGIVVLTDADAMPVGTSPRQAAAAEAEVDEATAEIAAEEPADADEGADDDSDDEASAPAPKKGRPSAAKKTAAKKTAAKKTAKKAPVKAVAKKATAKKVPAARPTRRKPAPVTDDAPGSPTPTSTVKRPAGVVATGVADTHVVDEDDHEEPAEAKPQSYGDLDSIPDDYD